MSTTGLAACRPTTAALSRPSAGLSKAFRASRLFSPRRLNFQGRPEVFRAFRAFRLKRRLHVQGRVEAFRSFRAIRLFSPLSSSSSDMLFEGRVQRLPRVFRAFRLFGRGDLPSRSHLLKRPKPRKSPGCSTMPRRATAARQCGRTLDKVCRRQTNRTAPRRNRRHGRCTFRPRRFS